MEGDIRWGDYYEVTKDREPRELFLEGLDQLDEDLPKESLEIGFGSGNEVIDLLNKGWSVIAVDAEPQAVDLLKSRTGDPENLQILTKSLKKLSFNHVHLFMLAFLCHFVIQIILKKYGRIF